MARSYTDIVRKLFFSTGFTQRGSSILNGVPARRFSVMHKLATPVTKPDKIGHFSALQSPACLAYVSSPSSLLVTPHNQARFLSHHACMVDTEEKAYKKILYDIACKFNKTNSAYPFKNVVLLGIQHMLLSTVWMVDVMRSLGLDSKNIVLAGKPYSTNLESVEKLKALGVKFVESAGQLGLGTSDESTSSTAHQIWSEGLPLIQSLVAQQKPSASPLLVIVLSDGGHLLRTVPPDLLKHPRIQVASVEQTNGGARHSGFRGLPFVKVNVAGANPTKTKIEYPAVAEICVDRMQQALAKEEIKDPTIAIIGYGTMGKVIAEECKKRNITVVVYDKRKEALEGLTEQMVCPSAVSAVSNADMVVECTGTDITADPELFNLICCRRKKILLASAGSGDRGFNSLLVEIQNIKAEVLEKPMANLVHRNRVGFPIILVGGTFPLNFNNQPHSVPPNKIWPTRAMLLTACMQLINLFYNTPQTLKVPKILQLDAQAQHLILECYLGLNPTDAHLQEYKALETVEKKIEYISIRSEGVISCVADEHVEEVSKKTKAPSKW